MPAPPSRPRPIDEFLGPASGRYFGAGYRRVEQRLAALRISGDLVTAQATLAYPGDWSRKASKALRPHLSTVDALVFTLGLVEAWLTHTAALTLAERRVLWLRRFEMRAGSKPQEDLDAFAVSAQRVSTNEGGSVFVCRIGTIGVECEVAHGPYAMAAAPGIYTTADAILGTAEERYWGAAYKQRRHAIEQVAANATGVGARLTVSGPDCGSGDGFGADHQPCTSMLDCFLMLAQLSQVIAYEHDGITRATSQTLWMRRLAMRCETPRLTFGEAFDVDLELRRARHLRRDAGTWSLFDLACDFSGLQVTASMAHLLPLSDARAKEIAA